MKILGETLSRLQCPAVSLIRWSRDGTGLELEIPVLGAVLRAVDGKDADFVAGDWHSQAKPHGHPPGQRKRVRVSEAQRAFFTTRDQGPTSVGSTDDPGLDPDCALACHAVCPSPSERRLPPDRCMQKANAKGLEQCWRINEGWRSSIRGPSCHFGAVLANERRRYPASPLPTDSGAL